MYDPSTKIQPRDIPIYGTFHGQCPDYLNYEMASCDPMKLTAEQLLI